MCTSSASNAPILSGWTGAVHTMQFRRSARMSQPLLRLAASSCAALYTTRCPPPPSAINTLFACHPIATSTLHITQTPYIHTMFAGSSPLLAVVLSSLSLAHAAAANDAPAPPASGAPAAAPAGGAIPQCAANCMSVKITEAALWFGAGEVSSYCKHPEFLLAYNNCLHDNCKGDDLTAGKQAGVTACAGVTPNAPGGAPTGPGGDANNSTGHLSGPANAPGANSTIAPNTPGTNPANSTVTPTAVGLNGALPTTPNAANATNTTTGAPSRFSGAVGSAAANTLSTPHDYRPPSQPKNNNINHP
ncbi:hypothetical protein PSHT_09352 [Puccinia striiformis]|uniref:CFEM domain-containing protein n=1 Tax=Puccinia striiformis TaxID=27350 RepID=A0A2S4VHJ1_9BASI|nr:hypothetical protein PSHT_09352 [Puccinia striiformis]